MQVGLSGRWNDGCCETGNADGLQNEKRLGTENAGSYARYMVDGMDGEFVPADFEGDVREHLSVEIIRNNARKP